MKNWKNFLSFLWIIRQNQDRKSEPYIGPSNLRPKNLSLFKVYKKLFMHSKIHFWVFNNNRFTTELEPVNQFTDLNSVVILLLTKISIHRITTEFESVTESEAVQQPLLLKSPPLNLTIIVIQQSHSWIEVS